MNLRNWSVIISLEALEVPVASSMVMVIHYMLLDVEKLYRGRRIS